MARTNNTTGFPSPNDYCQQNMVIQERQTEIAPQLASNEQTTGICSQGETINQMDYLKNFQITQKNYEFATQLVYYNQVHGTSYDIESIPIDLSKNKQSLEGNTVLRKNWQCYEPTIAIGNQAQNISQNPREYNLNKDNTNGMTAFDRNLAQFNQTFGRSNQLQRITQIINYQTADNTSGNRVGTFNQTNRRANYRQNSNTDHQLRRDLVENPSNYTFHTINIKSFGVQKERDADKYLCGVNNCNYVGLGTRSLLKHRIYRHTKGKLFVCEFTGCNARYKMFNDLVRHHNDYHASTMQHIE